MAKFRFVDLFSGIGGFHIASKRCGGECVAISEINKDAVEYYNINHKTPTDLNKGNIKDIDSLPAHELMCAGVPCQSWSTAGHKLGFDDERGLLWNDTISLLKRSRPSAFVFENVNGLVENRNSEALEYIASKIRDAEYHARIYILNASDYGLPQNRSRMYIVGFKDKVYYDRLCLSEKYQSPTRLGDILDGYDVIAHAVGGGTASTVSGKTRQSLSVNDQGFNDYFIFNDIRNGDTTIHSWDITDTTPRQKHICTLILKNRRKKRYGVSDSNALRLDHIRELDSSVTSEELDELVGMGILKHYNYRYSVIGGYKGNDVRVSLLLSRCKDGVLVYDEVKRDKELKKNGVDVQATIEMLVGERVLVCDETRYEFKNTKMSVGVDGINRIFLPSSKIFPTMVASDTNDFVSTVEIFADNVEEWKSNFMEHIYRPRRYRKITKSEACRLQGFPYDFVLPERRERWMRLIGNSVAVPVVEMIVRSVVNTGVFDESDWDGLTNGDCRVGEVAVGVSDKRRPTLSDDVFF